MRLRTRIETGSSKMALPAHRAASGERYEGYADLWHEVAYIIARRK